MNAGSAWWAGRVAPLLLALVLCSLTAPVRASSPLPLVLEEVTGGKPTELAAGPAALHVVFFAPWCPPCVAELERLADMEDRWGERGYRLVLIAVRNRNTRERLLRFAEQHRPPGTIYLDTSGEAQQSFATDDLPAHFLIDASGTEVGRWQALDDDVEDAVRKLLRSPNGGS